MDRLRGTMASHPPRLPLAAVKLSGLRQICMNTSWRTSSAEAGSRSTRRATEYTTLEYRSKSGGMARSFPDWTNARSEASSSEDGCGMFSTPVSLYIKRTHEWPGLERLAFSKRGQENLVRQGSTHMVCIAQSRQRLQFTLSGLHADGLLLRCT